VPFCCEGAIEMLTAHSDLVSPGDAFAVTGEFILRTNSSVCEDFAFSVGGTSSAI